MTVLEVKKCDEEIESVISARAFESPVQVTFMMEEELYKKLSNTADFFKETPYDVLCNLCENAERFMIY